MTKVLVGQQMIDLSTTRNAMVPLPLLAQDVHKQLQRRFNGPPYGEILVYVEELEGPYPVPPEQGTGRWFETQIRVSLQQLLHAKHIGWLGLWYLEVGASVFVSLWFKTNYGDDGLEETFDSVLNFLKGMGLATQIHPNEKVSANHDRDKEICRLRFEENKTAKEITAEINRQGKEGVAKTAEEGHDDTLSWQE